MVTLETTQPVPLTVTQEGTIRVSGSRVNLDSVIYLHLQGESAEQIQESFPSLKLADIYAIISYYLNHRASIDAYLQRQSNKAEQIRQRIESAPEYRDHLTTVRARIQDRKHSG